MQGVEGVPLKRPGHPALAVLDSAALTQLTGSSDSSVLKGSLQDEVRPAGVPLQYSCLCGDLPFGILCQAWQLTCASCSLPSCQQHRKGSSLQHCLSPAPNAASHTPIHRESSSQSPQEIKTDPLVDTACKSGLYFSNMHMTPCKSSLTPQ